MFKNDEEVWILNGMRNRAFAGKILEIDTEFNFIRVFNQDKGAIQVFDLDGVADGEFSQEPPIIVPLDNEVAQRLEYEGVERDWRSTIEEQVNRFRNNPTSQNKRSLLESIEDWAAFFGA